MAKQIGGKRGKVNVSDNVYRRAMITARAHNMVLAGVTADLLDKWTLWVSQNGPVPFEFVAANGGKR